MTSPSSFPRPSSMPVADDAGAAAAEGNRGDHDEEEDMDVDSNHVVAGDEQEGDGMGSVALLSAEEDQGEKDSVMTTAPPPPPRNSPVPTVPVAGGTRRGGTRGSTKAAAFAAASVASGGGSMLPPDSSASTSLSTSSTSTTTTATTIMDATTQAAFIQASAILQQRGYPAVAALINSSLSSLTTTTTGGGGAASTTSASASAASASGGAGATNNLVQLLLLGDVDGTAATIGPLQAAVEASASKLVAESPPWVHWSRSDSAPQLKIAGGPSKTTLLGGYRGYRMGRATAGLSSGQHYYEVVILPAPSAQEIHAQLPPSARLGPGLESMLKLQHDQEEKDREREHQQQQQQDSAMSSSNHSAAPPSSSDADGPPPGKRIRVGGHVRLGFSMRTGELQAPVGYDKWSYAIRDIGGSLVHKSHRQDSWWSGYDSIEFGPGDVVGCALCFDAAPDEPHIRFFLNGECLGNFVISKGKRVGGVAFAAVEPGCYYPAVSLYMGGGVRANFGPHWIYPPRKLPTGFPKLQPVSASVPAPKSPNDAVDACGKALKLLQALRRPEYARAVKAAIEVEAKVQCDAYDKYLLSQLEFVHDEREDRGLTTADLKEKLQQLQPPGKQEESAGQ